MHKFRFLVVALVLVRKYFLLTARCDNEGQLLIDFILFIITKGNLSSLLLSVVHIALPT